MGDLPLTGGCNCGSRPAPRVEARGGGEKWLCGDCGSSLFGRNPESRHTPR